MRLEIFPLGSALNKFAGATLLVSNEPQQEPLLVAEQIALAVIDAVDTIGITTPQDGVDYDFFEGYRARDGLPGFAIYGKTNSDYPVHIASVKQSLLPATASVFSLVLEVPSVSPLRPDIFDPGYDRQRPLGSVPDLFESLAQDQGLTERVLLSKGFYAQFDGEFERHEGPLPEGARTVLRTPDHFSIDPHGKYIVAVTDTPRSGTAFNYGHVRRVSDNHRLGGLSITDSGARDKDSTNGILSSELLAVYGKGPVPIFTAKKKPQS